MAVCQNPKCGKEFTPKFKAHTQRFCSRYCRKRIQHQNFNASHPPNTWPSQKAAAKKKAEQLGMESNKANRILHKMVLFEFAKRLGMDRCYRCKAKIETLREFSLDHKQRWLDVSVSLFWDIDNVAFSHLRCNIADGAKTLTEGRIAVLRKGRSHLPQYAVNAPIGFAWCTGHKQYLSKDSFAKSQRSITGTQSYCRVCHGEFYKRRKNNRGTNIVRT